MRSPALPQVSCTGARSGGPRGRLVERGLTLIEILVVLAIVVMVMGVAVAGSNQLPSSRLRRTATMIASAIKVSYTRATATSRDLRLVLDIDHSQIWIEETDVPMLVQDNDAAGTGGAAAVTKAEQAAREEGAQVVKGPAVAKPTFRKVAAYGFGEDEGKASGGGKPLQRGITFRGVQTAHDDVPRKEGRAYLYFWPGGLTERASIQLRIGQSDDDHQTLTLLVSPLTGRVTVKAGPVDLTLPTDDSQASDRQDTGF